MKKVLRSKTWTAIALALVFAMLAGLVALCVPFCFRFDFLDKKTVFLEGEYSVDGGEWKTINNNKPITQQFRRAVFKGTLVPETFDYLEDINISSKNVWYTLKTADGKLIGRYAAPSGQEGSDTSNSSAKTNGEREYFDERSRPDYSFESSLPNTPGYANNIIHREKLQDAGVTKDTVLVLEVENPYRFAETAFSDAFEVTLSRENGAYLQFFFEALPTVLFFVLVCFFGLFLFPVAGFILGRVNYKCFAFGALCFFWGLSMISQKVSGYLNLWIIDSTVCMAVNILLGYFFVITTLFYLKSNLERSVTRAVANATASVYILMVIAAIVLHFTGIIDLYASTPNIFIYTALCNIILTVLLVVEALHDTRTAILLVSWTPLTISIIIDAVNHYLRFTDVHFYYFGLGVTMLYQVARLVMDLKKQYKEAIRYQQMQRELYEAKVSVMVSQIQPHFMYNALTSIAMMCTIDPETAQEATVTFAKYLRGNMDSLKQTKPIPFEQELEHLKKYLYIEKLRFGKKLNIEYDINATDFVLPQLSIQPIVENAVKHGVGMKKQGGTVTIATRETDDAFEVVISDDGVGFDTSAERKDDGRSHVGMENTQRRLRDMCGGEVRIESTVGEGTVATVILPKKGQQNENTLP